MLLVWTIRALHDGVELVQWPKANKISQNRSVLLVSSAWYQIFSCCLVSDAGVAVLTCDELIKLHAARLSKVVDSAQPDGNTEWEAVVRLDTHSSRGAKAQKAA